MVARARAPAGPCRFAYHPTAGRRRQGHMSQAWNRRNLPDRPRIVLAYPLPFRARPEDRMAVIDKLRMRPLLQDFGVEITDIDLARAGPEDLAAVVAAFHRHG